MGYDLFILGILIVTTIRGAAKGVAWQLAGIAALVLCFLFATPLSLTIAPMIKVAPPLNRWIAMLGIYLVFSFGTFAVARGFREALEKAKFVEFDRHLGALFGLTKGAIIALVITFFAVAMTNQARSVIMKTYTGYAAAHIMNALDPVMPKELHAILEPYIHTLDAVDPALAAEREQHHQTMLDDENSPPQPINSSRSTSKGYRPTSRNPQQTESEDSRVNPRDPFQSDDPDFDSPAPGYKQASPTLEDPFEGQNEPTAQDESPLAWLKDLPHLAAKVTPAIKQQLLQAFENTAVEHRDEFIERLKSTTPDTAGQLAQAWRQGRPAAQPSVDPFETEAPPKRIKRPADTPQPPTPLKNPPVETDEILEQAPPPRITNPKTIQKPAPATADPTGHRQQLLRGIARVFSSVPTEQAQKMTEIETALLGLPDQVINGVLADWLADLYGDDNDPDPHTDLSTNLNARVARQIDALGMPHQQLSNDWQARLERFFKN